MRLLPMLPITNPMLAMRSATVNDFQEARDLAADMIHTMRRFKGAGLAAVQVGRPVRMFVMGSPIAGSRGKQFGIGAERVIINPIIVDRSDDLIEEDEGCLSMPGLIAPVARSREVTIEYTKPDERQDTLHVSGFEARVLQHEFDHLEGRLHIDYVSPLKRQVLVTKFKKALRMRPYLLAPPRLAPLATATGDHPQNSNSTAL